MTGDNSHRVWVGSPMVLAACCCMGASAKAADTTLACLLEDSVSHAQRALEISFNERAQYVTVNGKTAVADISDTRITFRVELSDRVPLDFALDRASGVINIVSTASSAKTRVIYSGQCKILDPT
ncbi:MAG: hypothetical protein ABJC66_15380 [Gammaproteobacteria bacterium]